MIQPCDSYNHTLNTPLGNRPLCFRTTVAGRGVLPSKPATMRVQNYKTPEYTSWRSMKNRCHNPKCNRYANYGGKGVKICERWLGENGFKNFVADMGLKPTSGHSIDRFPNHSGNYEPENCRWATRVEQQNNRDDNRILTHNGESLTASQWAKKLGFKHSLIHNRIKIGWSIEAALTVHPNHVLTKK